MVFQALCHRAGGVTRAGLAAVWAVCGLGAVRDIVLVYGPTHHSRPTGPRGASSLAVKGLCHRSVVPNHVIIRAAAPE